MGSVSREAVILFVDGGFFVLLDIENAWEE